MPRIKEYQLIDTELKAVADRASKVLALAADKVIANSIDPQKYPISPGSIESIFKKRFEEIPTPRRQSIANRQKYIDEKQRRIAEAQRKWQQRYHRNLLAKRQRYYDSLSQIDIKKRISVVDQVPDNYFFGQTRATLEKLSTLQKTSSLQECSQEMKNWLSSILPFLSGDSATPAPTNTKLQFLIKQVKCIDETTGFLGTEAGADEISLGGYTINPVGTTQRISPMFVKNFQEGGADAIKEYDPPHVFAQFDLNDPDWWPKQFFVGLVLAEIDMGGFGQFLSEIVDQIKIRIAAELATSIGVAAIALSPFVGLILLVVVFAAVIVVFELLKDWWEDDVFKPVTTNLGIESADQATFDGVAVDEWGYAIFKGQGGKYLIRYTWRCCP